MNPETIQKLKTLPEFQQFIDFLVAKLSELDSLSSLQGMSVEARNDAVSGRLQAVALLGEIVAPLLDKPSLPSTFNGRDYAIDPDDVQ